MKTLTRMIRAARLDAALYEEVELDTSATPGAVLVVILSSIAAGVGLGAGWSGILALVVAHLAGWLVWAILIYWIGTRLLPEDWTESNVGELLRTVGFATAPGILRILSFLPVVGPYIFWIASVWMLAAVVLAVRQALDYSSTIRAVVVCALGWTVHVLVLAFTTVTVS